MMTIEKLDELREAANKLLEEKRRVEGGFVLDPFIRDAARARYRVAVGAATDAVMEWVAQGCKAPPVLAGGTCCYCKVPFLVGEVRIDADGEGTPCHEGCYREPPRKLRDPPINCTYCDLPITQDETMIGAGDGSGSVFAHDVCYWRKQANLRQEETDARVKEAVQHNDAYHGARYEEQAKTLQRTRGLIMERSNNIRECIIAIRGLLKVVGPAAEDAACHADLVDRRKCSRCSRIDRATQALARLPSSLLSEALKVEP